MLSTETKDKLAMDGGNTGTIYTPEGTDNREQVNVLRAWQGNHGGGRRDLKREEKVNITK